MDGEHVRIELIAPSEERAADGALVRALTGIVGRGVRELAIAEGVEIDAAAPVGDAASSPAWVLRVGGRPIAVPDLTPSDSDQTAAALGSALHRRRDLWLTNTAIARVQERTGMDADRAASAARHVACHGVSLDRIEGEDSQEDALAVAERAIGSVAPLIEIETSPDIAAQMGVLRGEDVAHDGMQTHLANEVWEARGALLPRLGVAVTDQLEPRSVRVVLNDVRLPALHVADLAPPAPAVSTHVLDTLLTHIDSLLTEETLEYMLDQLADSFAMPVEDVRHTLPPHALTAALRALLRDGGNMTDLLGVVECALDEADEHDNASQPSAALLASARARLGCGIPSSHVSAGTLYAVTVTPGLEREDDNLTARLVGGLASIRSQWPSRPRLTVLASADALDRVRDAVHPPFPDQLVRCWQALPPTLAVHEVDRLT